LFSDIQRAFPGLAGSASNLISDYFARAPSLAPPVARSNVVGADPATQLFSRFMGLNALTPSFGALANSPVAPDNAAFPYPVRGTNAVFLAGGLLTALVGGNAAFRATLSIDLIDYLDNRRFHLGTGVCTFAVDATSANALPSTALSIASSSLGTLALSTNSTTSFNAPVIFRCTNFYGNWGTFTITLNLVPAPYAASSNVLVFSWLAFITIWVACLSAVTLSVWRTPPPPSAILRRGETGAQASARSDGSTTCSADSCGAIDPVNDPDYNMREVIKNYYYFENYH
jgi:hypothetical protein